MTARRCFSLCLLLPLVLGLAGLLTPRLGLFTTFLLFGGLPYALTALVLAALLRRASVSRRVALSLATPPAFAVLCVLELVWVYPRTQPAQWVGAAPRQLLVWAGVAFGMAAAYIALAWLLWALVRGLRTAASRP